MRITAVVAAAILLGASSALAQSGISGANVTIQLPNFTIFGVNTTVLVPDSGPSPLARQRQARYSRAMYGRTSPQRAFGVQRGAAIGAATADIHDLRAEDEAVLRAARARRTNWVRGTTSRFDRRTQPAGRGLQSVADIERQKNLASAADNREALALVKNARRLEALGKGGVAAVYYRMAASKASGDLKEDIEAEARQSKAAASVGGAKPAARLR